MLDEKPAIADAGMRVSIEKPLGCSESATATCAGALRFAFAIALPGSTTTFVARPRGNPDLDAVLVPVARGADHAVVLHVERDRERRPVPRAAQRERPARRADVHRDRLGPLVEDPVDLEVARGDVLAVDRARAGP